MIYGLYLSTAGAKAQSWREDVIANNIANANSSGFRTQFAHIFARKTHEQELGVANDGSPDDLNRIGGGVHQFDSPSDWSTPGAAQFTGRNLDLAIDGLAFFKVKQGDETFLTRAGSFTQDRDGFITTTDGARLMLESGSPLKVDPFSPITINADGEVFQEGASVGVISLCVPEDLNTLQRHGANLLSTPGTLKDADARVKQNFLEGSNVDPVRQMVEMIEASRAYQININMIQLQNDGLSALLQSVPRVL